IQIVYEATPQINTTDDFGYDDGEDLYEAVETDQLDVSDTPPALPGLPPSGSRPTIQPTTEEDEDSQDVYEYLPEEDQD
uniref:Uncharacterized protein n=1 Tax=Amphimedon queenslandica TaxID=400682 RepID=A0A1X7SI77_AMPQE